MADINAIADQIQGLSLLEASQLVVARESCALAAAVPWPWQHRRAARPGSCRRGKDRVHGDSHRAGANKINVIKAAEVTSPGLKEAKDLVGWRAQAHQGRRQWGRGRESEEVHRGRRQCR